MAIAGLTSFGPGAVDYYTPLADIGRNIGGALAGVKRQQTLGNIDNLDADGQLNFGKIGAAALQSGDTETAFIASKLAQAQSDRVFDRGIQRETLDFRKGQAAIGQANNERDYKAGRQDAASANRRADWADYYRDRQDKREDARLGIATKAAENAGVPPGYQRDPAKSDGLRPAPGGPHDPAQITAEAEARASAKGGSVPAELGARLGLGNQFLDNDLPFIRDEIKKGSLSGVLATGQMAVGMGTPGEIHRRVQTGLDALARNLTCAGKSESEARDYVARYSPQPQDTVAKINSKLNGLEKDLMATRAGAIAGRNVTDPALTGRSSAVSDAPKQRVQQKVDEAAAAPASSRFVDTVDQVKEGARFKMNGRIYKKVNGQPVPEGGQ